MDFLTDEQKQVLSNFHSYEVARLPHSCETKRIHDPSFLPQIKNQRLLARPGEAQRGGEKGQRASQGGSSEKQSEAGKGDEDSDEIDLSAIWYTRLTIFCFVYSWIC